MDEIRVDLLGNVIGTRRGSGGPRVMLAAHMDEIGFIVKHIDDRGFIRLHPVGGFDPNRLPAQRVIVHGHQGRQFRGAIGVAGKPVHLQTREEIRSPTVNDLFVDTGLPADLVQEQIEIGDMVTMDRSFEHLGDAVMTKALDDRVGLFIMLEALRTLDRPISSEIIAVATVQEEVGVRGATTSAFSVEPDIALAIDITPAGDIPDAPAELVGVRMGSGVGLKLMDTSAISDVRLLKQLRQIADDAGIPNQHEILGRGGTDASAMQRARSGAAAATLSIPVRYAHTVNEMCAIADVQATIDLAVKFLSQADEENLAPA